MNDDPPAPESDACYELRFLSLFNRGHGFCFPCDAKGTVRLDTLSARERLSYLHVLDTVGSELSRPVVAPVSGRQPRPAHE